MNNDITISGIQTNNLKNIDIALIKGGINLIVGPSGSGKSSLAYDTIAQIGQRELFSMFADDFSEFTYKVKDYQNMIATVPIKQLNHNNNIRSTIGTYFGLNNYIISLYSEILELNEDFFVLNKAENLCPHCHGLGIVKVLDENRLIDYNVPLEKNPFKCWNRYKDFYTEIIVLFCVESNIDIKKTFRQLTTQEKHKLLYGESNRKFTIKYKRSNGVSQRTTKYYGVMSGKNMLLKHSTAKHFYSDEDCQFCSGAKYSQAHNEFKLFGVSIGEFMLTPFNDLIGFLGTLKNNVADAFLLIAIKKIELFIQKANELGVGHLFFHRTIPTLSGGELQRLRLVQVFNSQLTDLLLVLDEPLAGLSGDEKEVVYKNILELANNHTLVIVEHSDIFVKYAKKIIALGEKSGIYGGYIVNPQVFFESQKKVSFVGTRQIGKKIKVVIDNKIYNFRGIDVCVAERCLNLIVGKSGIGKSTLLREYFPQYFESYDYINQKPLLGNNNSTVATALEIFRKILAIFATKCNKDKHFFNSYVEGEGACPKCKGSGFLEYGDNHRFACKECCGTGFNPQLRKYKVFEKSIFDIWDMTIDEAIEYFEGLDKKIHGILLNASNVLLGHLKIGQLTSTLSGGENIRIKILKMANSKKTYLGIDEPFKGLGNSEIVNLITLLHNMICNGKTILIIEHNEESFRYFDMKIQLILKDSVLVGHDMLPLQI